MPQPIDLLQAQAATQTVFETGVNPTTILSGVTDFNFSPGIESNAAQTLEGLAPTYNTELVKEEPEASLTGIMSYQDIYFWLDGMFGIAAPGAGPVFSRTWDAPLSAMVTPRMYTLYYGPANPGTGYRFLGAIPNTFNLSASANEELRGSIGFMGKSVRAGAPGVTLTARSVNYVMASQGAVFIDLWGGTIGTTAVNCTAYSFALNLTANRKPTFGLGSIGPCDHFHTRFDGTLSMVLEFPGKSPANVTKDMLDAHLAPATIERQIRLRFTRDANNIFTIDFAGFLTESPDLYGDQDGSTTLELNFRGKYNPTLANWLKLALSNELASIEV